MMQVSVCLDQHVVQGGHSLKGRVTAQLSPDDNTIAWEKWPRIGTLSLSVVGKCLLSPAKFNLSAIQGHLTNNSSAFIPSIVTEKELTLVHSEPVEMAGFLINRGEHTPNSSQTPNSSHSLQRATFYTHSFSIHIPQEAGLPPSYVGSAIRFIYYLLVDVRNIQGSSWTSCKVPFSVIPSTSNSWDLYTFSLPSSPVLLSVDTWLDSAIDGVTGESFQPELSVSEHSQREPEQKEIMDEQLKILTSGDEADPNDLDALLEKYELNCRLSVGHGEEELVNKAVDFHIVNRNSKSVVILRMAKNVFFCGDEIRGIFDFTNAEIPCYRLSLSLERHEVVSADYASKSSLSHTNIKTISSQHLYAYHIQTSSFALSLPHPQSSPPSIAVSNFTSKPVSVQWCIRLKLVLALDEQTESDVPDNNNNSTISHKVLRRWGDLPMCPVVDNSEVEVLEWVHPLQVFYPEHRPRLFNRRRKKTFFVPISS